MLVVINPRMDPESTIEGWLRHNEKLFLGLVILAVVLLMLSWAGQRRDFDADKWYAVTASEGVLQYSEYASEAACLVASPAPLPVCVPGSELAPRDETAWD